MGRSAASMAHEAISPRGGPAGRLEAAAGPARAAAVAAAARAFVLTRALVLAVAVLSALALDPDERGAGRDLPDLTHPFGDLGDALLAPLARWDAVWYLSIANDGYAGGPETAFFPLYPLLVWLGSGLASSPGAALVCAYAISLSAFFGALYLLHRLVELELGRPIARAAVLLVACFPASVYFGAPYTESLFLLFSVAAFYAARTGRWAAAGALAAAASATRSAGLALVLPLALLYLYGPREDRHRPAGQRGLRPPHAPEASFLWLALAPLGLLAHVAYLELEVGDGLAFLHNNEEVWGRGFAGPFGGIWDGAVAAWEGARELLTGAGESSFVAPGRGSIGLLALQNLLLFGLLLCAIPALAGVFRRLPPAYGVYAVAALGQPLTFPTSYQPLQSLPRFLAVLFPIFMWLALVCERRRLTAPVLIVFAVLLCVYAGLFANWRWVA